ncbi:MAG: hypothetical protein V3S14_13965, partial [Anaerolineae bacterium]
MNKQLRIAITLGLSILSVLVLLLSMLSVRAEVPIPPDNPTNYTPDEAAMAQFDLSASTKGAPSKVAFGDTFTYTIVVVNSSLVSGTLGTTISDTLPTGVSYVSGTLMATAGVVTPTASGIEWSGIVMASSRITITFAVTATALPGRVITNTAVISDAGLSAPVTVPPAITLVARPVLSNSTKTASHAKVASGDPITYTIVISNNSIADAPGTTISDTLHPGVSYVSGTLMATAGITSVVGNVITWTGTVLASSRVTITFLVTATASPGETITNSAVISAPALSAPVTVPPATTLVARPDFSGSTKTASHAKVTFG